MIPQDSLGNRQSQKMEKSRTSYIILDEEKIAEEARYDGLYAVCTDLFDDDPRDILKVSEGRWQIEACFRIIKTDFSARPVYLHRNERIKAHFLICFFISADLPTAGKETE